MSTATDPRLDPAKEAGWEDLTQGPPSGPIIPRGAISRDRAEELLAIAANYYPTQGATPMTPTDPGLITELIALANVRRDVAVQAILSKAKELAATPDDAGALIVAAIDAADKYDQTLGRLIGRALITWQNERMAEAERAAERDERATFADAVQTLDTFAEGVVIGRPIYMAAIKEARTALNAVLPVLAQIADGATVTPPETPEADPGDPPGHFGDEWATCPACQKRDTP